MFAHPSILSPSYSPSSSSFSSSYSPNSSFSSPPSAASLSASSSNLQSARMEPGPTPPPPPQQSLWGAPAAPPPGGPLAPPPPPPPDHLVDGARFRVVKGLGEALHEAKKRLSGLEETPACSEGIATGSEEQNPLPPTAASNRPKSWHGGKPALVNRAVIDEMQNKLAARRAKVDKEGEVLCSEGIGGKKPPSYNLKTRPHSYGEPISSLPPSSRGWTPPTDHGPLPFRRPSWTPEQNAATSRKISLDSGVFSRDSREHSNTPPVNFSSYRRVSVDLERKEELLLAKQVRQGSVKIMRMSPVPFSSAASQPSQPKEQSPAAVSTSLQSLLPPPSPIVLRYWKQCTDGEAENSLEPDKAQEAVPAWKMDALEGEATQFPSIREKIIKHEEEAAKPQMVTRVPDVRRNLNLKQSDPQGWLETRQKLQAQLDTLLNRTSVKIGLYNAGRKCQEAAPEEDNADEEENPPEKEKETEERRPEVDPQMKSLIQSVAFEIQKSFSKRNLHKAEENEDEMIKTEAARSNEGGDRERKDEERERKDEERERKDEERERKDEERERKDYWQNMLDKIREGESVRHREEPTLEPPILDFTLAEPEPEIEPEPEPVPLPEQDEAAADEPESGEETKLDLDLEPARESESSAESHVQDNGRMLDAKAARDKASMMRKSSHERRLPASVLAKRRAAEKLKNLLNVSMDAQTRENVVVAEGCFEEKSEEEKAEFLAKQMSKLESSQILQILRSLETGALDCSIPVLIPYLSLQVRLSLSKHLYQELDPAKKVEMVRESFLDSILNDITDIAILQEVIQRSQEKLNSLTASTAEANHRDASTITEAANIDCQCPPECHIKAKEAMKEDLEIKNTVLTMSSEVIKIEKDTHQEANLKALETSGQHEVKSEDEGYDSMCGIGSGVESSCEDNLSDDKEEMEVAAPTNPVEKSNSKVLQEQEISEPPAQDISLESIAKSKSEKDLKSKILSILQEAKAKEENQRNLGGRRNFGRNFEQQPVVTPVVPDKRTEKARRMDSLWSQSVARRQGTNFNGVEMAAKPAAVARSVPWRAANSVAVVKKDSLMYNKEVEDFEKCRQNLDSQKQQPTVKKADTVSIGKKSPIDNKKAANAFGTNKMTSDGIESELKQQSPTSPFVEVTSKVESAASSEDYPQETGASNPSSAPSDVQNLCDSKADNNLTKDTRDIEDDKGKVSRRSSNAAMPSESAKRDLVVPPADAATNKSMSRVASKAATSESAVSSETDSYESSASISAASSATESNESSASVSAVSSATESNESSASISTVLSEKATRESPERVSTVPSASKSTSAVPVASMPPPQRNASALVVRPAAIPPSPATRRRVELCPTPQLPATRAGAAPPPPPSFRPPPPPMSPPPTVSINQNTTEVIHESSDSDGEEICTNIQEKSANGNRKKEEIHHDQVKEKNETLGKAILTQIQEKREEKKEDDEEEESEWEWTEEEEEVEEEEWEAEEENWENIMSTAKGPTTFKAQFSIKIPVK